MRGGVEREGQVLRFEVKSGVTAQLPAASLLQAQRMGTSDGSPSHHGSPHGPSGPFRLF